MEGRDRRSTRPQADTEVEDAQDAKGTEDAEVDDVIELVGIDHVQLSMPSGGEAEARRFYGSVLGLREVTKPAELAARGGCWFAGSAVGVAIHLGVEPVFRPLAKAHPALLIRDLEAGRSLLAEAGVPIEDDDSGLPVRRCYVRDPFGNRIELVDARDAGFSER